MTTAPHEDPRFNFTTGLFPKIFYEKGRTEARLRVLKSTSRMRGLSGPLKIRLAAYLLFGTVWGIAYY